MSTRSNAVSQWHWVTTPTNVARQTKPGQSPWYWVTTTNLARQTKLGQSPWYWVTTLTNVARQTKPGQHELWAGAGYLLVWSLLWLAVIVTVLAPLEGFVGVAR